jgi:hypothetical protein
MILKGCLVCFCSNTNRHLVTADPPHLCAAWHHDMSADIRSLRRRRSLLPRPVFGRARSTPPSAVPVVAPVAVIVAAPVASLQRSLGFK